MGSGIDKDRQDFTVEWWRVNSPFSLLAEKNSASERSGESIGTARLGG